MSLRPKGNTLDILEQRGKNWNEDGKFVLLGHGFVQIGKLGRAWSSGHAIGLKLDSLKFFMSQLNSLKSQQGQNTIFHHFYLGTPVFFLNSAGVLTLWAWFVDSFALVVMYTILASAHGSEYNQSNICFSMKYLSSEKYLSYEISQILISLFVPAYKQKTHKSLYWGWAWDMQEVRLKGRRVWLGAGKDVGWLLLQVPHPDYAWPGGRRTDLEEKFLASTSLVPLVSLDLPIWQAH